MSAPRRKRPQHQANAPYRPGERVPASGIYRPTEGGTDVALSRGNRFPPTKAGGGWVVRELIEHAKRSGG